MRAESQKSSFEVILSTLFYIQPHLIHIILEKFKSKKTRIAQSPLPETTTVSSSATHPRGTSKANSRGGPRVI